MRPMHKSSVRSDKFRKLSKQIDPQALERCIPDDKGAQRQEQRRYCEDVRMHLPPLLVNGLHRIRFDHDTKDRACEGCVEDEVAVEFDGKHI